MVDGALSILENVRLVLVRGNAEPAVTAFYGNSSTLKLRQVLDLLPKGAAQIP